MFHVKILLVLFFVLQGYLAAGLIPIIMEERKQTKARMECEAAGEKYIAGSVLAGIDGKCLPNG